jgi:uncharacterized protein
MSNLPAVKAMYEAFARGDVPAILERLSRDVEWEYGSAVTTVPWLQPRRGRAGAEAFFASLGELDIERFEPTTLFENGPLVVALCDFEATVKATGRRISEVEEVHIWKFDAQGLATGFRHRVDTLQQELAYVGYQPEAKRARA